MVPGMTVRPPGLQARGGLRPGCTPSGLAPAPVPPPGRRRGRPDARPRPADADDPRLVDVQHRERHVRVPGVQPGAPAAQLQRVLVGPRRCPPSAWPAASPVPRPGPAAPPRGGPSLGPPQAGLLEQGVPGTHLPPGSRPQWIMDVLVCNGLGIYCGMKTLEWLSLKTYKWQGLWNIPTYKYA